MQARSPRPFYHHQCYAHGLHLAVQETLKADGTTENAGLLDATTELDNAAASANSIGSLLDEIRAISKDFRRPKRANKLAKLSALRTRLDSPVRWDSSFLMMKRFVKLKACIEEVFRAEKKIFPLSTEQMEEIRRIIKILQCVARATKKLSGDDVTLLDADLVLEVSKYFFLSLESPFPSRRGLSLKSRLTTLL